MATQTNTATQMFQKKFENFRHLADALGEEKAWENMLDGYPERQKKNMGALIENTTLASGFRKAIPLFQKMGMEMEVFDISTMHVDAVIEVQRSCPVLSMCKEYGFLTPCHVVCEMDVEATRRAFPDMKGEILSRQADGACVCVFKYERQAQQASPTGEPSGHLTTAA